MTLFRWKRATVLRKAAIEKYAPQWRNRSFQWRNGPPCVGNSNRTNRSIIAISRLRTRPAKGQLVRLEGFEPPTLGSVDRCSNPLSYSRVVDETRS